MSGQSKRPSRTARGAAQEETALVTLYGRLRECLLYRAPHYPMQCRCHPTPPSKLDCTRHAPTLVNTHPQPPRHGRAEQTAMEAAPLVKKWKKERGSRGERSPDDGRNSEGSDHTPREEHRAAERAYTRPDRRPTQELHAARSTPTPCAHAEPSRTANDAPPKTPGGGGRATRQTRAKSTLATRRPTRVVQHATLAEPTTAGARSTTRRGPAGQYGGTHTRLSSYHSGVEGTCAYPQAHPGDPLPLPRRNPLPAIADPNSTQTVPHPQPHHRRHLCSLESGPLRFVCIRRPPPPRMRLASQHSTTKRPPPPRTRNRIGVPEKRARA